MDDTDDLKKNLVVIKFKYNDVVDDVSGESLYQNWAHGQKNND